MDKLYIENILDILEKEKNEEKKEFLNNVNSNGKLTKSNIINVLKDNGIELIEETMPYIENIYRNANRLIVNEEEIVKIELAKKITADSVKHLSKHTNFIQNINEKGNVEPSKILNINKEESYNTYENKLIYSLIKNITLFIKDKKDFLESIKKINKNSDETNDKKLEYNASTQIDGKKVFVNYNIDSKYTIEELENKIIEKIDKIEEIEEKIAVLKSYDIYKLFDKKRLKPITSPIKKTNLILKNVNFQYIVKLWDFLQDALGQEVLVKETTRELKDETILKKMMDEIFLLQYFSIQKEVSNENEELLEQLKENLVKDVLSFTNISNDKMNEIVEENKLRKSYIEKEIRKIFYEYMKLYEKSLKG